MAKKRTYKFTNMEDVKEVTALSLKKAVRSFQGGADKLKETTASWVSKKGQAVTKKIKLPWGRKKKLGR
jgi:hypothetical protein|tara:strand:+ start:384 stop:590 length:207 start_codon:yes stop_codon:yes gene_type:complete